MEEIAMPDLESMVESHAGQLDTHGKSIHHLNEKIERHEKRLDEDKEEIQQLKDRDKEKEGRLQVVEDNYIRLEKRITKENEETRETMRTHSQELYRIVNQAMGYQQTKTVQEHELKMARQDMWSKVFFRVSGGLFGLLSSGGVIYYVVVKLME